MTLAEITNRLEELESQMAFQDELHASLNDVVARQDQEISRLKQQIKHLSGQLKEVGEAMPSQSGNLADDVPPHY